MKINTSQYPAKKMERKKDDPPKLLSSKQALLSILLVCIVSSIITFKSAKPVHDYIKKWAINHGYSAFNDDLRLYRALLHLPFRLAQSFKLYNLPALHFDIKFKNIKKLNEKRSIALAKGILVQKSDDFVPASIRLNEEAVKVKLRLKGDWIDHLEGNKWSFRVHVKGKKHIFRMRRFSIQNPKVKRYQGEPLFYESLRQQGILVPRYFFVKVFVNGDDIGVMAVEEHFSKELLESNGRRESVIVRFDESLLWAATDGKPRGFFGSFDSYLNASIDAFGSSKIEKSENLSNNYETAVGLLRGFINGGLKASEVFDAELMGRYLGVAEFWGAIHSVRWHNQRFYLNPVSMRLEPIGFDADLRSPDTQRLILSGEPLVVAILKDPKIFKVYRETLIKLAKDMIDGGNLQAQTKTAEEKYLAQLRKEFYLLEKYPYDKLIKRSKFLLALNENGFDLSEEPPSDSFPIQIHAYRIKDDNGSYVEIANAIPYEVEVLSINWINKNDAAPIKFEPLYGDKIPFQLPSTQTGSQPKKYRVYFRPPPDEQNLSLEVTTKIQGQKQQFKIIAKQYYPALLKNPIPESSINEQLNQHSFLIFNHDESILYVKPGTWTVSGSIVIPKGTTLKIPAGTTLRFSPDAGIFSQGPLFFSGTKDEPILLEGTYSNGGENSWQGVVVLHATSPSLWTYVNVLNTSGISHRGWKLTGGITFYRSDIRLDHCHLQGNRGEDALNIIHAKFELNAIEISETMSDAFDADFADGEIRDGYFHNIGKAGGGDAVDISGSKVQVKGSRFRDINDKALSVGEQSKMVADNLSIELVGTGAACKDGSFLRITKSSISDVYNAGLMAYIKKSEYGPGRIEANDFVYNGSAPEARVQKGSSVIINGREIESENLDVKELYKTIMKPGLRQ